MPFLFKGFSVDTELQGDYNVFVINFGKLLNLVHNNTFNGVKVYETPG